MNKLCSCSFRDI